MLFSMLMVLASIAMPAKQADLHTKDCIAQISLRNNSWVLRKFTIISYPPGNTGNNTVVMWLGPGMRRSFQFAGGTRVYAATRRQTEVVMSGRPLHDRPLLVVSCNDDGKVVSLIP